MTKGQNIHGLLQYLLGEKGQSGEVRQYAKVIGGTVDGTDINELSRNFMLVRALKPDLKTYVINESLRLPENEKLDSQKWAEVADSWAQGIGLDTYTIVQHSDNEVHIAGIRITSEGKVVSDSQDWKRSEILIRQIERDYGLQELEVSHNIDVEKKRTHKKAPTQAQVGMFKRTGKLAPSIYIGQVIDDLIEKAGGKITASDFVKGVQAAGIEVNVSLADNGRMNGFSYVYDGKKVKSQTLGESYKWQFFREKVDYEYTRDFETCRSTKLDKQFNDDIRTQQDSGTGQERVFESEEAKRASREREEHMEREKQRVKYEAARNENDQRTAIISSENNKRRGWWTGSDIANRIVHDAIKSQIDAFKCDTFSVRLLRRDSDEAPITRTFTREQLLSPKTIAWLRWQNMNKEILIRPLSTQYIMLDDVKKADLRKLYIHGLRPCAVVETSNENHQVWLDIGRELIAMILEFLLRLIGIEVDLSGAYADKAALTRDRYGKLAGFTNRKPAHEYIENGQVRAPFIKLIYTKPGEVSAIMPKLIAQATIDAAKHEAKKANKPKNPIYNKVQREESVHSFFARKLGQYASSDQSATDFSAVCAAIKVGYHSDDIKAVLQAHRTDKKNSEYYARHTVENAMKWLETKQSQAPEPELEKVNGWKLPAL